MISKVPLVSGRVFAGLILVLLTVVDQAPAATPVPPVPSQPASAIRGPVKAILPAPAAPNASAERPHEPTRDPTAPSPLLRELLKPAGKQSKMSELPSIQIKGRIIGGLQPNSALLQIDKRPYLVHKGTELTIPGGHSDTQTIRVVEVTADEVRIEVAPLGRVLTLN